MITFLLLAAPVAHPISFDAVLELASGHPTLEGRARALESHRTVSEDFGGGSANPQLTVLPGYRLGDSENPGPEVQVSLSQSFTLGGFAESQQKTTEAQGEAIAMATQAQRLELAIDAAAAWLALRAREAEVRELEAQLQRARELVLSFERAAASGAALASDVTEARAFAHALEATAIDAEGRRHEAQLDLAAAFADPAAELLETSGPAPIFDLPPPTEWAGWLQKSRGLPRARLAVIEARVASSQAAQQDAQAAAVLTPMVTYQRERPNDTLLWAGLGVQLPVFARNTQSRALAAADAAQRESMAGVSAAAAERTLRRAFHEVEHAREAETHATEVGVPNLERLVAQVVRRFEAREARVFELLRVRQQLAEARVSLHELEKRRLQAEAQAWLMLSAIADAGGQS